MNSPSPNIDYPEFRYVYAYHRPATGEGSRQTNRLQALREGAAPGAGH